LAREGGRVLLLGVRHEANSIIHVAEAYAEVPYLGAPRSPGFPEEATVRVPGGEVVTVGLLPIPTCSRGFGKLEPLLRAKGLIRYGRVGRARCQLMRAQAVIDVAVEILRRNPRFLLCDVPGCWACARKREMIAAAKTARQG
jgi:aminoglycoside N3'-acetyltransferase